MVPTSVAHSVRSQGQIVQESQELTIWGQILEIFVQHWCHHCCCWLSGCYLQVSVKPSD